MKKSETAAQKKLKEVEWNTIHRKKLLAKPKTVAERPDFHIDVGSQKNGSLKETSFHWLKKDDAEWYFTVTTEGSVDKDQQLYINYGNRSNRYFIA